MNWIKPQYEERRFGFEVTMYIYQKSNLSTTQVSVNSRRTAISKSLGVLSIGLTALISVSTVAQTTTDTGLLNMSIGSYGDGDSDDKGINGPSWPLTGLNRFNSSNASTISQINPSNVNKLKLKWVYSIPIIPLGTALNPNRDPRIENGASNGVAVDADGTVYLPTFDGHMYILDSFRTNGTDSVTGSPKPLVKGALDFFADPQYSTKFNPFASRSHPSIINGAIYAGNYKFFGAVNTDGAYAPTSTGTTSPTCLGPASVGQPGQVCPKFPAMNGAVLYKINPKTGKLIWQTEIDRNQQSMISAAGITQVPWILGQNLILVGFAAEISGTVGTFPIKPPAPDPFLGTCCNHRGGIAAVLESTGQLIWKTYTMPKQTIGTLKQIIAHGSVNAWFGGGVWGGGNFPVSYKHQMVYSGTGEAFNAPDAADACEQARLSNPDVPLVDTACLRVLQNGNVSNASFADSKIESLIPLVWSPILPSTDAIVAHNYITGEVQWSQPIGGYDVWNAACIEGLFPGIINLTPMCPPYLRGALSGLQFIIKDRDTAPPILVENVKVGGKLQDIVLGFSKGAQVVAFNAKTGKKLWETALFGFGGLDGDGFIWGKAADGNFFYGNTGSSSGITYGEYIDPRNPARIVPHSCDLKVPGPNGTFRTSASAGFGDGTGKPEGIWNAGMYVAINLTDGSVAWQRCAIAKVINPTTRKLTGETKPARTQGPVSVANGVVVAPGASGYIPASNSPQITNAYSEVLLFKAANGALLNSLPLSPSYNAPSANGITYQRPAIVGDRLYITNGAHASDDPVNDASKYNRVLMYQLSN